MLLLLLPLFSFSALSFAAPRAGPADCPVEHKIKALKHIEGSVDLNNSLRRFRIDVNSESFAPSGQVVLEVENRARFPLSLVQVRPTMAPGAGEQITAMEYAFESATEGQLSALVIYFNDRSFPDAVDGDWVSFTFVQGDSAFEDTVRFVYGPCAKRLK